MKLRMFGLLLALPLLCYGCEDGDATAEEETVAAGGGAGAEAADAAGGGAGAADAAEAVGPDATCTAVLAAIKAKTVEAVVGLSADGAADVVTAESIEGMAAALGEGTCGEAAVEGDAATVTVTVGEATKELKFVKAGEAWKFDAKAYADANPPAAPEGKAKKKGKKKKGKKKKKK